MNLKLIVLRCANIEKSNEFYNALGFEFMKEQHGAGPKHYSAESNGLVLELYPSKETVKDNLRLGFEISTIPNFFKIIDEYAFNDAKVLVVLDPDGRKIELYKQ